MSTVANILTGARAYLATLATSRDAGVPFKEHLSNEPFDKSPLAGFDGFEIVAHGDEMSHGFGRDKIKDGKFRMVVRLGHSEGDIDKVRDNFVADDIARLTDLIEDYTFPSLILPDDVNGVWFEGAVTTKLDPNWWLTEMTFRVEYTGEISTS